MNHLPAEPSSKESLLEVQGVGYRYDRKSEAGLMDVSFAARGVFAVLGPSGSFKSTLLKVIAGHLRPERGSIRIGGLDVTDLPSERRGVATVFQDFALFPHLSAERNVREGTRRRSDLSAAARDDLVREYLRELGVEHCAKRRPHELSGGEQQRVGIARALAARPAAILMDEPTAAIDGLQRESLVRLLRQLATARSELVALIVSHDREFVLDLAEGLAIIDGGRILASGPRDAILAAPSERRVAEILGTHSVVSGRPEADGFLSSDGALRLRLAPSDSEGAYALIRHDGVELHRTFASGESGSGMIETVADRGSYLRVRVRIGEANQLTADVSRYAIHEPRAGEAIRVTVRPDAVRVVRR